MSYELQFLPSALKEWRKFGAPLRQQFKKKLAERLIRPHVPADRLHGLELHYKIKLRSAGYRLVYAVNEASITVTVIAVGKRDKGTVYKTAQNRRRSQ